MSGDTTLDMETRRSLTWLELRVAETASKACLVFNELINMKSHPPAA